MSDATEALLQRIRAAKQRTLPVGDGRRTLQWRLPEWDEQYRLGRGGLEGVRAAVGLVHGWQGFTERDLVPPDTEGFGDAAVSFTPAALDQALAAQPALLGQLLEAVNEESARRRQAQEAASGN